MTRAETEDIIVFSMLKLEITGEAMRDLNHLTY